MNEGDYPLRMEASVFARRMSWGITSAFHRVNSSWLGTSYGSSLAQLVILHACARETKAGGAGLKG